MSKYDKFFTTAAIVFLLGGCGLGEDNVLFVTKTNFGLDIDTKPPTFDFGFDRKEGTVAPVFEDGAVLPQMAGFSSDVGIVNQATGQSFATGTATVVMSRYLTSDTKPDNGATINVNDPALSGTITTTGKRKRYFFATNTNFGLRVNFGLETGGIPDSLSLGYKRKEAAFVRLIEGAVTANGKRSIALASLLATSGISTELSSFQAAKVVQTQFFATGLAASNLAALPEIRRTVAPRIMPDAAKAIFEKNAAAAERGKKLAENIKVKVSKVVATVAANGTIIQQSLIDLFNKTDLASSDTRRIGIKASRNVTQLETKLENDPGTLDKLVAKL